MTRDKLEAILHSRVLDYFSLSLNIYNDCNLHMELFVSCMDWCFECCYLFKLQSDNTFTYWSWYCGY